MAGLQFLAEMVRTGQPASALTRSCAPVPQLLKNVRYTDGQLPLDTASVQQVIAAAEIALTGKGRLLIRKSGTEPLIRVMAECEDEGLLLTLVDGIVDAVRDAV